MEHQLAPGIGQLSQRARALPRWGQFALLGGAALAAVAAATLVPYRIMQLYAVPRVLAPQPHKLGTIRLTDAQWLNIKTGQVKEITFRNEHRTDEPDASQVLIGVRPL
ncbi:MAG: hypothetical protein JO273_15010 [Methylobacteriaceae bacterium]|nr:hypothetical protein [Methylobacteriaceae bacterium]